jgi:hypothetical protein
MWGVDKAQLGPVITKEQERKPHSSKGGSARNSAPFRTLSTSHKLHMCWSKVRFSISFKSPLMPFTGGGALLKRISQGNNLVCLVGRHLILSKDNGNIFF